MDKSMTHRSTRVEDEEGWYVHCIDATDHIVWVNPAWLSFAQENGARSTALGALGTRLWTHLTGAEVRHLYTILLEQVRHTGRSIRFPFRCDTPTLQRFMEMVIVSQPDGYVVFRSRVLREQPTAYVALFEAHAPVSDKYLCMCSWCRKVALAQGEWVEPQVAIARLDLFSTAPMPQITHSICPLCNHDIRTAAGLPSE